MRTPDSLKPDKDGSDGRKTRLLLGAACWFKVFKGAQTAVLADFERVDYDSSRPSSLAKPNGRRLALHALLSF